MSTSWFKKCSVLFLLSFGSISIYGQVPYMTSIQLRVDSMRYVQHSDGIFLIPTHEEFDFIALGNYQDTTIEGENYIRSWLTKLSSSVQDTIDVADFVDTLSMNDFILRNYPLVLKNQPVYYIYTLQNNHKDVYFVPVLTEFNSITGEIINSTEIVNEAVANESFTVRAMCYNNLNEITLLNTKLDGGYTSYITEVDTMFSIINQFQLEKGEYESAPFCMSVNQGDEFIEIIGNASISGNGTQIYYAKYNFQGSLLSSKLLPANRNQAFINAYSKTCTRDNHGNWIIAAVEIEEGGVSSDEQVLIPYVSIVDQYFDTLLAQTRFFEGNIDLGGVYLLNSLSEVNNGYVVAGQRFNSHEDSVGPAGVLFKVSINGDSVWMHHYIPEGWESSDVSRAILHDVEQTQDGYLIAIGEIKDKQTQTSKTWVIYTDEEGCLVKDCLVASVEITTQASHKPEMRIYPNPSSGDITIEIESQSPNNRLGSLELRNLESQLVGRWESPINSSQSFTTTNISSLAAGVYVAVLYDLDGNIIGTERFVKL